MKTILTLLIAFLSLTSFAASTLVERLEVNVENAFAPQRGFDDNDNVQIVIHGYLPNTCYTLSDSFVERADGGTRLIVHQFATRQLDGICAQDVFLPEHLKMAVPFTSEVSLGQMPSAEYTFEFKGMNGLTGIKSMNVSQAKATTIDSLPYAVVQATETATIVNGAADVKVRIVGVLNSTCTELNQDIILERFDDTFVVLPTIKVKPGVLCAQILVPFEKEINLGKLKSGNHYLIHARSMNGRAINKVIEVGR